ncbi:hypothetical protein [Paenibacillus sp. FSL R7-0179]|uniref:hypothetical protein n=1 Tax=Paenibacillus sp. FSL R7-0179 TaxID=2921672 RepID=UPI0030F4E5DC
MKPLPQAPPVKAILHRVNWWMPEVLTSISAQIGAGAPTIILEAGSGETSLSRRDIPEKLAEHVMRSRWDIPG